jgi:hypothetical protein
VSVSQSASGGLTFADSVKAIEKSLGTHFIDKEWLAVDPTNPPTSMSATPISILAAQSAASTAPATPVFRIGVELVRSTDGGNTWGPPVKISSDSENFISTGFVFAQGSQVFVDGNGRVHVVWEQHTFPCTDQIRIATSNDHGVTFGGSTTAAEVIRRASWGGCREGSRATSSPPWPLTVRAAAERYVVSLCCHRPGSVLCGPERLQPSRPS